jgi:hypothetical protein
VGGAPAASGGNAGLGDGGTGGTPGGAGGMTGTGGAAGNGPLELPTGDQGFPTNSLECPAALPSSGADCNSFNLVCQYPDVVCTCTYGQFDCTPQQNQCLEQAHCASGYCHPTVHVCTECVDNTQCTTSERPRCRSDGVCVECVSNTDCDAQESCEAFFGVCQAQ